MSMRAGAFDGHDAYVMGRWHATRLGRDQPASRDPVSIRCLLGPVAADGHAAPAAAAAVTFQLRATRLSNQDAGRKTLTDVKRDILSDEFEY
jgi:hypothetical protein